MGRRLLTLLSLVIALAAAVPTPKPSVEELRFDFTVSRSTAKSGYTPVTKKSTQQGTLVAWKYAPIAVSFEDAAHHFTRRNELCFVPRKLAHGDLKLSVLIAGLHKTSPSPDSAQATVTFIGREYKIVKQKGRLVRSLRNAPVLFRMPLDDALQSDPLAPKRASITIPANVPHNFCLTLKGTSELLIFEAEMKVQRSRTATPTAVSTAKTPPGKKPTDGPTPGGTAVPTQTRSATATFAAPTVTPPAVSTATNTPLPPAATATRTTTPSPTRTPTPVMTPTNTPIGGPPGLNSPTGRNPRALWTREQQYVWNEMQTRSHPWWLVVKDAADRAGTANANYGDWGQWAAMAYQVTGNATYAQKAFTGMSGRLAANPGTRNETREYFAEAVIFYDWIYPGLSDSQRTTLHSKLAAWAELVLAPGGGWGTRTNDTDETTGHFFGLALMDVITGTNYLSRSWNDGGAGTVKPVGGLTSSGANHTSMRNAVRRFAEEAQGGQWVESTEYNLGTVQLAILGTQAIKTATGVDYFPEYTTFFEQAATNEVYEVTSDLEERFRWGDSERPEGGFTYGAVDRISLLTGVNKNRLAGRYLNRFLKEVGDKHGWTGYGSAQIHQPRGIYLYNPYGDEADWRVQPNQHYANGRGLLFYKDSWSPNGSTFFGRFMVPAGFDHETADFGDFQLYSKGGWALKRPFGYMGPAATGLGANSMVIAGLSSMNQRSVVAQASGVGEDWTYFAGNTKGQYYWTGFYDPPPTFLHEWTRSLLYLPSSDAHSDTIVVFDRIDAENPRNLPKLDRYFPDDRGAITGAPALKQWVIHSPVSPTLGSNEISWTAENGQQVKVSTLLPANQTKTIYNESAIWGTLWNFHPEVLKYHVRVAPQLEQRWDVFLNVVQAYDSGTTLQNSTVSSANGEAKGVLIHRTNHPDTLIMFGAQQSTRVLSTGYTLNVSTATGTTELFLTDLDPSKIWRVSANGGAPQPVTVNSAGVGRVTVNGPGSLSLTVSTL